MNIPSAAQVQHNMLVLAAPGQSASKPGGGGGAHHLLSVTAATALALLAMSCSRLLAEAPAHMGKPASAPSMSKGQRRAMPGCPSRAVLPWPRPPGCDPSAAVSAGGAMCVRAHPSALPGPLPPAASPGRAGP